MVNKKGWLRIVEAFFAVALIAGFLIVIYLSRIQIPDRAEEMNKYGKSILEQISQNFSLRDQILANSPQEMMTFAQTKIPSGFNFTMRICEIGEICGMPYFKPEVYSSERTISSNLTKYDPKKIKIFLWMDR